MLVDGQQRVTTVLILLCALRDLIEDASTIDSINKRYLFNDTSNDRYRIRLKQTAYDSNCFAAIIDKNEPEDKNGNIIQNYNLLKTLIKSCNIDPIKIYETIPKLEIVEVNLQVKDDLKTVQTIFEKLNSTGEELKPADLIRNLLLLTPSAEEQNRLYLRYWQKIEQTLKSENISRFSRDYVIMKTFSDVPEKQIYKLFKAYFQDIGAKNENILDEMAKSAVFYAWIRFESCPDDEINRCLKMLNILKTDDIYPLFLYLLFNMFNTHKDELGRIFILLTDFMLRYRVVTPSGGGGTLRTVVHELIENLNIGIVEFTKDSILLELSNSASPAGRFPDDTDFKQHLVYSVNPSYARVVLLKIEENETHNIPIDISKVTVEHLMPQTLSAWWKSYLGGEVEAERIHTKYINSIGNLTPVSQSYNSSMSNSSWDKKMTALKDVQFAITTEIVNKYTVWNEENICARNEIVACKAIHAVTSPLPRTKPYRTKGLEDYTPGKYLATDISIPMIGASIVAVYCGNKKLECSRWKDLLVIICAELIAFNKHLFQQIVNDNAIHKATSKKNYPNKDPVISLGQNFLIEPMKILDTEYYTEGCLSGIRARVYTKQLLELFKCPDDYFIEIA